MCVSCLRDGAPPFVSLLALIRTIYVFSDPAGRRSWAPHPPFELAEVSLSSLP